MNKTNQLILALTTSLTFTSATFASDVAEISESGSEVFKINGYKPIDPDTHLRLSLVQKHMGLKANVNLTLPTKVNYKDYCKIMDQGSLGSCTANSLVQGRFSRQAMAIQESNPLLSVDAAKKQAMMGSRLWLYYEERVLEGTVNQDGGASLYSGMQVMHTKGLASEGDWPYIITKYKQKPSDRSYKNALPYIDTAELSALYINSRSPDVIDQMKMALSQKYMLSVGIMLYTSFQSATVQSTGKVSLPDLKKEKFIGGHAVLVVGYKENKKEFKLANSWGEGWGKRGFFTLPYEYFNPNNELVSEIWKVDAINPAPLKLANTAAEAL
jgi:C1A family cysteine protease